MFAALIRVQRALNHCFERLFLEDRYRYLARRGGFEGAFDDELARHRERKQYGAVRLAFAHARQHAGRDRVGKAGVGKSR